MTTTPRGSPAGCHSRVKILTPSTPLKLATAMSLNLVVWEMVPRSVSVNPWSGS
jgi:hypothetical protein